MIDKIRKSVTQKAIHEIAKQGEVTDKTDPKATNIGESGVGIVFLN